MTTYCRDCAEWIFSSYDSKVLIHNGRPVEHRWCEYDKKMRASDQDIYRCGGFRGVKRAVITKVCEILYIESKDFFEAFDDIKDEYIVPTQVGKLIDYNFIGSSIAEGLDNHPQKENIAKNVLNTYIVPALALVKMKDYEQALSLYERMVKTLAILFEATKEQVAEQRLYNNLISIR